MNTKLKKIAFKLQKKFAKNTLNETFKNLLDLTKNQQEYFKVYKPDDIVKIGLYIYSLNQTGDYNMGDSMISNCHVGGYFEFNENDFYTEECDECNGNGYENCDSCDGTGEKECSNCDGEGKTECEACDGDGIDEENESCPDCNGTGEITCEECDGEGRYSCNDCGGDGSVNCNECDGKGMIETDKLNYYSTSFLVWDNQLINMFTNSFELEKPMSIQDLFPLENEDLMVIINENQSEAELNENVKPDKKYCFHLEKLGNDSLLILGNKMMIPETPDQYKY